MRYGWSLERIVWETLRQRLNSTEWHEISFAMPSSESLPSAPGTYLIAAPPPLPDHPVLLTMRVPIYIGHTGDLKRRMREHLRGGAPIAGPYSRLVFCYFRASDVAVARQAEQKLIDAFGPPGNRRASIRVTPKSPIPAGRPRTQNRTTR